VADYRWHDNRHTFATGLLRATGNLKLVQNALHHARIEPRSNTLVLDDELRAGMEQADRARESKPGISPAVNLHPRMTTWPSGLSSNQYTLNAYSAIDIGPVSVYSIYTSEGGGDDQGALSDDAGRSREAD
jgi:hypothetical protein